jgi:O-antigen/teichoic acid export membrane protein
MGLILIINALSITQVTILTKKLDFKTKTKASLISAILSGIIGIAMAFSGFGVWALVAQQISKQLLYTTCLWILNRWWPNFSFDTSSFKYMWGFGWKIMLSGLLNNIWAQLYQVVVGKFYSPSTLGQYSRSKEYASIFSSQITTIVQRVTYPVLSEIQNDQTRMLAAYRKVIKVTMFVTCVSMLWIASMSESLIMFLIGPQWHEASTYLPLICISMSLYPLHAINLNMLQVQGRSDIFLYLEVIKKFLAIFPISMGIFIGIYWMLIASIITGVISFFLNTYYTGVKLNYSSWSQIKDVAPAYWYGIVIAICVYFFKFLPVSNSLILLIQVIVGMACIFVYGELTHNNEYLEIKRILVTLIKKFSRHIPFNQNESTIS